MSVAPDEESRVAGQLRSQFQSVGKPAQSSWLIAHDGRTHGGDTELFFLEGAEEFTARDSLLQLRETMGSSQWITRLPSFPGDFSFAHVDRESLRLVRAAAGVVPVYFWSRSGQLAIATRLGDIARFSPGEPRLDGLVNAAFVTGHPWFIDGRSLLRDTRVLGAGEVLACAGTTWRIARWWNPSWTVPRRPSSTELAEHGERLRATLVRNVERGFATDGRTLLTLSGGVDSSCLAAIASSLGRRFSTLSFLPASEPQYSRSRSYIDPLLAQCGDHVRHRWEHELSVEHRSALLDEAPREVFHVAHPALCVLPRIRRAEELSVLCGGEFCDDLFGSWLTLPDWALSVTGGQAVRDALASRQFRGGLRTWAKLRLRHVVGKPILPYAEALPQFADAKLTTEYRARYRQEQRAVANDPRIRIYLVKRLEAAQATISVNFEVTSGLAIRRVFPFFCRPLIELAFDSHPAEGIATGTKVLFREAMKGLVPERNLMRPDKESWCPTSPVLPIPRELPAELDGIVRPDWLEKPPRFLPAFEALQLKVLMNIVESLRNVRVARRG